MPAAVGLALAVGLGDVEGEADGDGEGVEAGTGVDFGAGDGEGAEGGGDGLGFAAGVVRGGVVFGVGDDPPPHATATTTKDRIRNASRNQGTFGFIY